MTDAVQRAGFWSRLSDRCNAILVREVQQAVKGRVFPLTILIALAITVVIAAVVSSDYVEGGDGSKAFDAGLATLVPLLVFVVPMQAYNSMRTELKGGIVEQLLLSRLRPGEILFGKLQAAMVQFVLYVSVLSPLLATSYLLRGVDLPTIGLSLLFACLICVSATAFAISSAAQAVVPAFQPIANLGIAFGLGMGTFALVSLVGSGAYREGVGAMMRSRFFLEATSATVVLSFLSTVVSWLAARSFLLHTFENKSTAFRIFLFTLPPIAYGWMMGFVDRAAWPQWFQGLTFVLVLVGAVFGVFMITEQRELSPRVRVHVPGTTALGALVAPLLPGRDRGLLCFTIYSLIILTIGMAYWPSTTSIASRERLMKIGLMVLAYAFVYLGLGRWLRARLPETVQGSQAGRVMLPIVLFAFCVVPLLIDVLLRGDVDRWHLGHVMNPFWTIDYFDGSRWNRAVPFVVGAIVGSLLLQLPAWRRGIREVRDAVGERQGRERGGGAEAVVGDDG